MCARRRSIMNSQPSLAVVCPSRRVRPGNTSSFVHAFASSHHWYRLGSCLTRVRQGTAREFRSVLSCRKRPSNRAVKRVEPTGIEPVTSCLQSARDAVRLGRGTSMNTGYLVDRGREAGTQDPSKSERFRALIGRQRPMARSPFLVGSG